MGLFGAKKSAEVKKEDGKKEDDEFEDIKTATAKKGGHKGLLIHFESRC